MRAVVRDRYGLPDVLQLRDVDTPSPGEGDVLVRVHAASLNTADSEHLLGRPRLTRVWTGLRRPRAGRIGLDVAGTVDAVGSGVNGLRVGDRVWADLFEFGHGSLAEHVCAPATAFAPIPDGVSFEIASTVPHSALLALQGLRAAGGARPGASVLVVGAGGCVGPFAVQIAKAEGAEVTAVDHAGKLEMLRELGADRCVDFTREDVTAGTQRYDVILDIADREPLRRYRRCLAPGGRYVLIARTLSGFLAAAVIGGLSTALSSKRMGVFMWRPNRRTDLDAVAELLVSGRVVPRIDRRFSLDEVADAFGYLQSGQAQGKVVVTPMSVPRSRASTGAT
jgi:NADPH:quinone reductase-like Zn-dependent oxidoreductase